MADQQIAPVLPVRFPDKRKSSGTNLTEDYTTISSMKSRLKTLKPATYTDAVLYTMTVNDLQFALRHESADSAGLNK
jgi:hypothetical protein